ncbi:MAG: Uncharacterized protein FD157_1863 [Rhodocyclaceae bacterium]|nr:MAG: Uncharacterized protein FD157_1863 [Rhodocyclaceae bacterium]
MTINAGGTISETAAAVVTFGNNLTNNGNTYTTSTGLHTFSNAAPVIAGGSAITFGGAVTGTTRLTINKTAGAVTVNGALTVGATGLTVTAGTLNLANTTTVTGPTNVTGTLAHTTATGTRTFTGAVTINAGGTWNEAAAAAISFGNNLSNSGTFTSSTGTHTFTAATASLLGSQPIAFGTGTVTANNLTVNKTAGVLTTTNGILNVNGNLIVTLGTLNLANAATVTGTTSITGVLGHTTVTGLRTFTGAVTINSGGTMSETAAAALVFDNNLTISNGGTLTENGAATMSLAGNLQNDGSYTASTGTHTFSGAARTISGTSAITIPNLAVTGTYTNSGTLTAGTTLSGAGTLANGNGTSGTLNIGGTSTIAVLTASASNNTVSYTGVAQTVKQPSGAPPTYYNLTLAGSGAKTMPAVAMTISNNFTTSGTASATAAGALTIGGSVTLGSGTTFNAGALSHTVGGNFTNNGATFTASTSTITLNGTAAQAIGGTAASSFTNLTISNTAAPVSATFNFNVSGTLTVNASAILVPAAAVVVNNAAAAGTITGSGTVQVTRTAATAGYSNQYRFTTNTLTNLTVEYIGAAAQTVSALTYGKLKINNVSGVTLAGATTISTTLTLTSGGVTTGGNTFTVTGACPASVVVSSGYVVGTIQLTYPASATTTCTYPVGSSATAYTPIDLTAVTGAGGGTLTGSTTGSEHAQIATSDIDPTRSANRYWSLWSAGDTISLTSYSATFTFVAADVDGGATPTSFDIGKYASTTWTLPTPVTATATTTGVTGIVGPLSTATDFVVGEAYAAFVMSAPDGVAVVAGRPHRLRLTRTKLDLVTTLTGYSGAKNLDGWYTASGNHPAGATAPQICVVNVGGTCLPATGGSCVTLPASAPALNAAINNLSITFASGVADYCLSTSDVGQYTTSLRDDSNVAHPVTGTSTTLTARPFAVVVSNIVQGAISNPASSSDSSASPFVAGNNFSASVGGYRWLSTGTLTAGMGDADGDGVPDSAATYADVVTNGGGIAPRYADTVTLATDTTLPANFAPTAPPAAAGSLTGGTAVTVAAGTGSTTTLSYSEVGSFTLKATPATDYLGGGVDLSSRVLIYADSATATPTFWVGRFRPDHFAIALGSSTPGCGTFTYFAQDGFTTDFTLTAQNGSNATTTNYAGVWAKLGLTTWSNFVFTAATLPAGSTFAASATAPTGTWASGSATVSAKHQLSRPTALTGPTSITVSAQPVDGDGITLPAAAAVGSAPLRYGRLRLLNAYGSDLLPVRVPLRAEYYDSGSWKANTADSCTTIPAGTVAIGNVKPPASLLNPSATLPVTLSGGQASIILTQGATKYVGSVDLAVNLAGSGTGGKDASCIPWVTQPASSSATMPWLQHAWCSGKLDPSARASFGSRKAPYIYLRERY